MKGMILKNHSEKNLNKKKRLLITQKSDEKTLICWVAESRETMPTMTRAIKIN